MYTAINSRLHELGAWFHVNLATLTVLRGSSCCVAFLHVGFSFFQCLCGVPTPVGVYGYFSKQSNDKTWWGKELLNIFLIVGHGTISVLCSRSSDFRILGSVLKVSVTFIRQRRSWDLVFGYVLLNPPLANCIASFQKKYCDFYFREIISYLSGFLMGMKWMGMKHKVEGIKVLLFTRKVLW